MYIGTQKQINFPIDLKDTFKLGHIWSKCETEYNKRMTRFEDTKTADNIRNSVQYQIKVDLKMNFTST